MQKNCQTKAQLFFPGSKIQISGCVAEKSAPRISQSNSPGFEFRSDHYLDLFDGSHEF